jgi:hypothetical protein
VTPLAVTGPVVAGLVVAAKTVVAETGLVVAAKTVVAETRLVVAAKTVVARATLSEAGLVVAAKTAVAETALVVLAKMAMEEEAIEVPAMEEAAWLDRWRGEPGRSVFRASRSRHRSSGFPRRDQSPRPSRRRRGKRRS